MLNDLLLKNRIAENNPIKVGIVGAGEMGKGLINQIHRYTPGMQVSAIYSRNLEKVMDSMALAGIEEYVLIKNDKDFINSLSPDSTLVVKDIDILINTNKLDLLVDMTGSMEFSTKLTFDCINNGINILSFNAELDATIGPILKKRANEKGVKYSIAEGDQPGVTMNLFSFVKNMGLEPLVCGNIKGMLDHYRNPTTQESFAKHWGMSPYMATNFADGTKVAFEQACIANATGMGVGKRGMYAFESKEHIDDLTHLYDVNELKAKGGIVDFIIGPRPGPGVFVYATTSDEHLIKYLEYGKMGKGPLYSFYIPYHLLFIEIPISIARFIDLNDDICSSKNGPVVEVIAKAKVDLKKGDVIDEIGGYKTFGICENSDICRKENLLPMGLATGCIMLNDVEKDVIITFDDVKVPEGRMIDDLWKEQMELYSS